MNPPVSDGVQGAFLVAVIFSGSLAGGVALVFRDIADGVGCLLGGFCLSMWFLCLKAGGLIPSTLGKSIFIGCMSALVFSLAIFSKTRNYALIGSIPFSGATATVLGIDCFSRAGLKEFWIYIWGMYALNLPVQSSEPDIGTIDCTQNCHIYMQYFETPQIVRLSNAKTPFTD